MTKNRKPRLLVRESTPAMLAFGAALLVSAALISALLCGAVRRWAVARGRLDHPSPVKAQPAPVPYGGGLAVYATVGALVLAGALAAAGGPDGAGAVLVPAALRPHLAGLADTVPQMLALLGVGLLVCLWGWADDLRPMGPAAKGLGLAVLCAATPLLGVQATLHSPVGGVGALGGIVWLWVTTNAVNLCDNSDGGAVAVTVPICAGLFATALLTPQPQWFLAALALALGGALLGFGWWNRPPARLYLGDAGSLAVGYLLGVTALLVDWEQGPRWWPPFVLPLILFLVPLYDTMSVVGLRLRAGRAPWRGDRLHLAHRWRAAGLGARAVAGCLALLGLLLAASAAALPHAPAWAQGALAALVAAVIAGLVGLDRRALAAMRAAEATGQALVDER